MAPQSSSQLMSDLYNTSNTATQQSNNATVHHHTQPPITTTATNDISTKLSMKHPLFNRPPQLAYGWFSDIPPPRGPYLWPCIPDNHSIQYNNIINTNNQQSINTPNDITTEPPHMCYGWYVTDCPPQQPYFWLSIPPGYILTQSNDQLYCHQCYASSDCVDMSCTQCNTTHHSNKYQQLVMEINRLHSNFNTNTIRGELTQLINSITSNENNTNHSNPYDTATTTSTHTQPSHTSDTLANMSNLVQIGAFAASSDIESMTGRTYSDVNSWINTKSQRDPNVSPIPNINQSSQSNETNTWTKYHTQSQ